MNPGVSLSDLFTLQQVENFISNDGSAVFGSAMVSNLQIYMQAAHDHLADFLGYEFLRNTYTLEPYDGNGMHTLYLNNAPVSACYSALFAPNGSGNPTTDYTKQVIVYENAYLYLPDNYFHKGWKCWLISYAAGWPLCGAGSAVIDSLPSCILMAGLRLVSLYQSINAPGQTREGKASFTEPGGGMISYDLEAEKHILESCYEHKKVRF